MIKIMRIDEMSPAFGSAAMVEEPSDKEIQNTAGKITIITKKGYENDYVSNRPNYGKKSNNDLLVGLIRRQYESYLNTFERFGREFPRLFINNPEPNFVLLSFEELLNNKIDIEKIVDIISRINAMPNTTQSYCKKIALLADYSKEEEKQVCDDLFKELKSQRIMRKNCEIYTTDNDWNKLKNLDRIYDSMFHIYYQNPFYKN